jgi:hypothetical protein
MQASRHGKNTYNSDTYEIDRPILAGQDKPGAAKISGRRAA